MVPILIRTTIARTGSFGGASRRRLGRRMTTEVAHVRIAMDVGCGEHGHRSTRHGDARRRLDTSCCAAAPATSRAASTVVFMLDTRVLSRWVLRIDGVRVEGLSVVGDGPFTADFVGRVNPGDTVDAPLVVVQRRYVGRGLREEIEIRNHGCGGPSPRRSPEHRRRLPQRLRRQGGARHRAARLRLRGRRRWSGHPLGAARPIRRSTRCRCEGSPAPTSAPRERSGGMSRSIPVVGGMSAWR